MADPGCRLTGGELNAAISNAVVRIHSQYLGRGPTRARTFHRENTVVTILEDALTKAERTLAANQHRVLLTWPCVRTFSS